MKDNEFIELLNLYLDHEISPADAARLEAEVQRDPARRRVYVDYCRMHKACTLLADEVTTEAPAPVEFEPARSRWFPALYATAGLAAAACVAFVVFNRNSQPTSASSPALATNVAPAAVAAPVSSAAPAPEMARNIPRTVTVLAARQLEFQPVTTSFRLSDPGAPVPAAQDLRLTWIDEIQLSSLPKVPVESLRFDDSKSPLRNGAQHLGPGLQEAAESAAWQFQR
ncbi:MAG TPA: zf-HC2 domain-containing protein [Opitutaceae bacterium]|nr:zf-HC2 domain-containing protein [Opitutaceae bacterium]